MYNFASNHLINRDSSRIDLQNPTYNYSKDYVFVLVIN